MRKKRGEPPQGFGTRLAELRRAAGLTQVELAETIGTSQRMIAYYEGTADYPIARLLRNLSRALGVSADELLGLAPKTTRRGANRPRKSGARKI